MDKTIFSKYSNDRGSSFKIRTDICVSSVGDKYVKKYPLTDESKMHIKHILDAYGKLQDKYGDIVGINECKSEEEGGIRLPYICGHTLDEELNKSCGNADKDKVLSLINRYKEFVEYGASDIFELTDEFANVFGQVNLPENLKSTNVADIDLIFENVLIVGDKWNIIDYEWTFLFPVPVNFIIYRALAAFVEGLYAKSEKNLFDIDLYEYCGITSQEIIEYKKMIEGFERYVMQGRDTMKTLHGKISQKIYKPEIANKIIYQNLDKMGIQIFPDFGNGYDEEKSYFIEANIDSYGEIKLNIDIEAGCCGYRIDPAMECCILSIHKIEVDGVEWSNYSTNGFEYGKNAIVFDTEDSQLYIKELDGANRLRIMAKVILVDKKIADATNCYTKERLSEIHEVNNRLTVINSIAEERNEQILQINKLAEEQNAKVADLYKQLENLYIEKNAMEQKYVDQISQLEKSNQELNTRITDMSNTKVWKLYTKYQNVKNKSKS